MATLIFTFERRSVQSQVIKGPILMVKFFSEVFLSCPVWYQDSRNVISFYAQLEMSANVFQKCGIINSYRPLFYPLHNQEWRHQFEIRHASRLVSRFIAYILFFGLFKNYEHRQLFKKRFFLQNFGVKSKTLTRNICLIEHQIWIFWSFFFCWRFSSKRYVLEALRHLPSFSPESCYITLVKCLFLKDKMLQFFL